METYPIFFPPTPPSSSPSTLAHTTSHFPASMINHHVQNDVHAGLIKEEMAFPLPPSSRTTTDNNSYICGSNGGHDPAFVKPGKMKTDKKVRNRRYAFQTRSQVDILDDGYRWRKYGQKAVKNNKHPRSYYRCTHEGCNVKKQVQRLSKDEGVVVTTYDGMHTHPIEKTTDNFENILNQMQIYTAGY